MSKRSITDASLTDSMLGSDAPKTGSPPRKRVSKEGDGAAADLGPKDADEIKKDDPPVAVAVRAQVAAPAATISALMNSRIVDRSANISLILPYYGTLAAREIYLENMLETIRAYATGTARIMDNFLIRAYYFALAHVREYTLRKNAGLATRTEIQDFEAAITRFGGIESFVIESHLWHQFCLLSPAYVGPYEELIVPAYNDFENYVNLDGPNAGLLTHGRSVYRGAPGILSAAIINQQQPLAMGNRPFDWDDDFVAPAGGAVHARGAGGNGNITLYANWFPFAAPPFSRYNTRVERARDPTLHVATPLDPNIFPLNLAPGAPVQTGTVVDAIGFSNPDTTWFRQAVTMVTARAKFTDGKLHRFADLPAKFGCAALIRAELTNAYGGQGRPFFLGPSRITPATPLPWYSTSADFRTFTKDVKQSDMLDGPLSLYHFRFPNGFNLPGYVGGNMYQAPHFTGDYVARTREYIVSSDIDAIGPALNEEVKALAAPKPRTSSK